MMDIAEGLVITFIVRIHVSEIPHRRVEISSSFVQGLLRELLREYFKYLTIPHLNVKSD